MTPTDVDLELFDRVWEEAFENGELDVIDEAVASDYVLHTTGSPEPIRGVGGFKQYVSQYNEGFSDTSVTIEERLVDGNAVVERYTVRATHDGEFQGIPPTGVDVEWGGIIIHHMEDGKAVEDYSEYDALSLLHQLGVIDLSEG